MSSDIEKVQEFVARIRESLPKVLEVAALGVKFKAPYQVLCTREALIWRTEELARNAYEALNRNDYAVAAILARAITENAALAWKLMEVLQSRQELTPKEVNDSLIRVLAGSKKWEEAPQPFRVLKIIERMNATIPNVRSTYDTLSEFVHPNWAGVVGLYSKTNEAEFTTYFGRNLRGADNNHHMIVNALLGSLGCFEYAYNTIATIMPAFLSEMDSFRSDNSTSQCDDAANNGSTKAQD